MTFQNLFPLRIALCAGMLAIAPASSADSATLTISGRVLPGTCTLAASPISLDPVKANDLRQGDNQLKAGMLNVAGCVGVTQAVLSFDGIAADGDAARWKNTASTDPAAGVSISLLSGSSGATYLKKGDKETLVVAGDSADFPLRAGYYLPQAGAITAGAVQAEITITADYD